MSTSAIAVPGFSTVPALEPSTPVSLQVASNVPETATCVGVPVPLGGPVPAPLEITLDALAAAGFEGRVGQALPIPRSSGPLLVAVGVGALDALDATALREAAAAFARAARKHTRLASGLADIPRMPPDVAGQAVTEGVLLARYRYDAFRGAPTGSAVEALTLVVPPDRAAGVQSGAERARITVDAASLARDLGNAPPAYLTATRLAEFAAEIAARNGLEIEVFDRDALIELGCGGLLGVNAGSSEPPRMIKLTYKPQSGAATGHLAMVGKGIMYDSGGINLKPGDAMHMLMKLDMAGAAAIIGAMSGLSAAGCQTTVTGYLMCTDNMPSGSALKMGDVLRIHGGKTVEVLNTDAEGRLVMSDALVMAAETQPDAIVDIATLTGAALRALGPRVAAVFGNDQALVAQLTTAADRTDEPVWQLPLEKRYRGMLDSEVADISNMGGDGVAAGAITAALFLAEFVGEVPWAHIDIAGTMSASADEAWRPRGATGYGARLLLDFACQFSPPAA